MWRYSVFILIIALLNACVSAKKFNYIQSDEFSYHSVKEISNQRQSYRIQPNDILSIRVQSLDPTQSAFFNISGQGQAMQANQASLFLSSYSVDDRGFINLPIVGNFRISSLTIDLAQELIQEKINKYLKDAIVLVKLVSFKVTAIGEVRRPGTYFIYNTKATIFEVLGLAGDINPIGDRKKVKIIRQIEENSFVILLDLTDPQIIESPYYFLLPNDVIYVETARALTARRNLPLLTSIFALISTGILVFNFIDNN